ncbi:probable palmitoyltransferase ZDHHC12 isoform X1 [Xiphophorus maculatus]|uniref:probable palmitoyltransferase ZDHHC12 isoform X1 n=1 Tax=Xiphophorus maculatus TaxID=8083 RepID=UPI000C6CC598|nr:probable palmitoyltransferase ZDHHC12 isoform X1 [Xiphophorus maculatus]
MFKNVFGSGFLVRTAHVVLTWIITLILFLYDTELRKQEETGQLLKPVLFVLLVLVSVLLYFAVSLMDPGFILTEDSDLQLECGGGGVMMWALCVPVHSGSNGGAAGYDPAQHQVAASAPLRPLPAAAANEVEALPDVSALRAALRPSLPLDRELCRRAEPPLVPPLLGPAAAGAAVGASRRLDGPGPRPLLVAVAALQRRAAGRLRAAGAAGAGGAAAARVAPLPGVHERHHLGVHVAPPHLLPQTLRRRPEPVRPRRRPQPVGVLLPVGQRGVGAGVLQGGQRPGLGSEPLTVSDHQRRFNWVTAGSVLPANRSGPTRITFWEIRTKVV